MSQKEGHEITQGAIYEVAPADSDARSSLSSQGLIGKQGRHVATVGDQYEILGIGFINKKHLKRVR